MEASLTNALLQELVRTYERQEKERRKEDLDHYFKARTHANPELIKVKACWSLESDGAYFGDCLMGRGTI